MRATYPDANHELRNKGNLIGAKPPLQLKHVWAIRSKLQLDRRTHDLALFNLAIDSKLRRCDLVSLQVDNVSPRGYAVDREMVRQKKTGRSVKFRLTEQTREVVDAHIKEDRRTLGSAYSLVTASQKSI